MFKPFSLMRVSKSRTTLLYLNLKRTNCNYIFKFLQLPKLGCNYVIVVIRAIYIEVADGFLTIASGHNLNICSNSGKVYGK